MERPLNQQQSQPLRGQELYEWVAAQDTSRTHWREWRTLSEAERQQFLDEATPLILKLIASLGGESEEDEDE